MKKPTTAQMQAMLAAIGLESAHVISLTVNFDQLEVTVMPEDDAAFSVTYRFAFPFQGNVK